MVAVPLEIWHQRLGHVNHDKIKNMEKHDSVAGLHVSSHDRTTCDACYFGKQTANTHSSRLEFRDCRPGERFHSDVCHATIKSLAGNTMFVTLKDEASGFTSVSFIKSKADVHVVLESMLRKAQDQTGVKAKTLRVDNGTEYLNKHITSLLQDRGMELEKSAPYVKQGNGIAERVNRTLCDMARSLLFNADLTRKERNSLWAEAVATAVYLRNRVPNKRTGNKTPHELWFGKKPDVQHLRVFGSPAFVKVPESQRSKFDSKSCKLMFVGYDENTDKIVSVYDKESRSIDRVSDVKVVDTDCECFGVFVPDPALVQHDGEEDAGEQTERRGQEKREGGGEKRATWINST